MQQWILFWKFRKSLASFFYKVIKIKLWLCAVGSNFFFSHLSLPLFYCGVKYSSNVVALDVLKILCVIMGCLTQAVLQEGVKVVVQACTNYVDVTTLNCVHQRCLPASSTDVNLDSFNLNQTFHYINVPRFACKMQRSAAIKILNINIGFCFF